MTVQANLRLAATALAGTLLGTAAIGQSPLVIYADPDAVRTEYVSYADLDLTSVTDAKRLNARIGGAIERVCLIDVGRDGLQDRSYYSCADGALNGTRSQVADAVAGARLAGTGKAAPTAAAIRISAFGL